jgi:hypothetical protein
MKTTVFAIHECAKAHQHSPIKVIKVLGPFGVKWNLHVDVKGGMMVGIDYCPYCATMLEEAVKAIPSQA